MAKVDDIQDLLLDKVPRNNKHGTHVQFIDTNWSTQRKAILNQLRVPETNDKPNHGWMFHEILLSLDSDQLLNDTEIIGLIFTHLARVSSSDLYHYLEQTRPFAIFLVGVFNYGLRSPNAEKLLSTLAQQKLGFFPFLMRHVEVEGEGAWHLAVYNFLEFFVDIRKPPELHINFGKSLCAALKFACDTQFNVTEGKRMFIANLQMLLLSYMETIGDEITSVGEEIASSLDLLAGILSRQNINTDFNELSHTLLTVIIKKYTKNFKLIPETCKKMGVYLNNLVERLETELNVGSPASTMRPKFYLPLTSPSYLHKRSVLMVAELMAPLMGHAELKDTFKNNKMPERVLKLFFKQGNYPVFYHAGVVLVQDIIESGSVSAFISKEFVKQVLSMMNSPLLPDAHYKEIARKLLTVKEFAKVFEKSDILYLSKTSEFDGTLKVNIAKAVSTARKKVETMQLEHEIADLDAEMKLADIEQKFDECNNRVKLIRAIWKLKKQKFHEKMAQKKEEREKRESGLQNLLADFLLEERTRLDQEQKLEKERIEREIAERERMEREREEREEIERERMEREHEEWNRMEREREERERIERERIEREQIAEMERIEREREEWIRKEQEEREKIERKRKEREHEEWNRMEREREERERIERERIEREQIAERERTEREREEWIRKEQEEKEKIERKRKERECEELKRIERESEERDKKERENKERESEERERKEREHIGRNTEEREKEEREKEETKNEERGKEEREKEERGKEERGKEERGKEERGKEERGKEERGKEEREKKETEEKEEKEETEKEERGKGEKEKGEREREERDKNRTEIKRFERKSEEFEREEKRNEKHEREEKRNERHEGEEKRNEKYEKERERVGKTKVDEIRAQLEKFNLTVQKENEKQQKAREKKGEKEVKQKEENGNKEEDKNRQQFSGEEEIQKYNEKQQKAREKQGEKEIKQKQENERIKKQFSGEEEILRQQKEVEKQQKEVEKQQKEVEKQQKARESQVEKQKEENGRNKKQFSGEEEILRQQKEVEKQQKEVEKQQKARESQREKQKEGNERNKKQFSGEEEILRQQKEVENARNFLQDPNSRKRGKPICDSPEQANQEEEETSHKRGRTSSE